MSQVWCTAGPFAKTTSDSGSGVALVLAPILYYALKVAELKLRGIEAAEGIRGIKICW